MIEHEPFRHRFRLPARLPVKSAPDGTVDSAWSVATDRIDLPRHRPGRLLHFALATRPPLLFA